VQGASENVLSADTVGSPGKQKFIHSVITRSSESFSDTPLTVTEASFCCALFYAYGSCEIQFRTKSFHLWLLCGKKTHTNRAGENFALNVICPSWDTISKLAKKVQTHSILIDRNPLKVNRVLTEEKLDDIGHWLENSPWKSLQRLALQSGVSVGSAFTATELLHIRLYKITVVPQIKPVRFCNWSINHVPVGLLDSNLTFFTDEANFYLSGYVKPQSNRYWSS
jgi:hypothetical protein